MKHFRMSDDRKDQPAETPIGQPKPSDSAFDLWLNRGLHELFDDVMKEPVPPTWLKILRNEKSGDDKKK